MKSIITILISFSFVLTIAACDSEPATLAASGNLDRESQERVDNNQPSSARDSSEQGEGLATLRRATARYHRVEAALDDGFVPEDACFANPEGPGGLGIPYINPERIDGIIDLEEPEVLFYEPQANGRLRLVGAEPIVPIELWDEPEPPVLFGQTFHTNTDEGLYGLHMWVWKYSSDGVFSFWHPDVTCEHAG